MLTWQLKRVEANAALNRETRVFECDTVAESQVAGFVEGDQVRVWGTVNKQYIRRNGVWVFQWNLGGGGAAPTPTPTTDFLEVQIFS